MKKDNELAYDSINLSSRSTSLKRNNLLHNPFFHIFLILLVGLLAYSNTFHVPFHFDDRTSIEDKKEIKDLNYFVGPIKEKSFAKYGSIKMRYVGDLTFALNYKFHGTDVTGYHIVNLLIHILNAILVYFFVVLTFKTPSVQQNNSCKIQTINLIALFSALLFSSHPLQTQAVTYIVQRFVSLATLFYLLCLVMYIKARLSMTRGEKDCFFSGKTMFFYSLSLVSAVLAMKTKEIAFTLPLVISLYEFIFFKGKISKRILYLIPILLTLAIIPLSLLDIKKPVGDIIGDVSKKTVAHTDVRIKLTRLDYLYTQSRVLMTYIRLFFFPVNQNLDYDYPIFYSLFNPEVFLSFIFLLSIFNAGVYLLYRLRLSITSMRLVSFGIFWFFMTLSVESSFIPITDVIFEHRMYLPSVGVILSLSTLLFVGAEKLGKKWKHVERAVITTLVLIVIIFSLLTNARNEVWKDQVSLWKDVVTKSPLKARTHYNLGNAYKDKGDFLNAEKAWKEALRIEPGFSWAMNQLGNIYFFSNLLIKAKKYYLEAVRINIKNAEARYNLALIHERLNEKDEAVRHYKEFLKIAPPEYNYLIPEVRKKVSANRAGQQR